MAYNSKFTGAQIDALLDASEAMQTSKEDVTNKVTSISADADDDHYPSAKAVFDVVLPVNKEEHPSDEEIMQPTATYDNFGAYVNGAVYTSIWKAFVFKLNPDIITHFRYYSNNQYGKYYIIMRKVADTGDAKTDFAPVSKLRQKMPQYMPSLVVQGIGYITCYGLYDEENPNDDLYLILNKSYTSEVNNVKVVTYTTLGSDTVISMKPGNVFDNYEYIKSRACLITTGNIFSVEDKIDKVGVVYNTGGVIKYEASYKCVNIKLELGKYYYFGNYKWRENGGTIGANNMAFIIDINGKGRQLVSSDINNDSSWRRESGFTITAKSIYRENQSDGAFVIKTPSSDDLLTAFDNLYLCLNVGFNGVSPINDLIINEGITPKEPSISIFGYPLSSDNNEDNPLSGQIVGFFGDSITAGTEGGYVSKVKDKLSLGQAYNYGSSGAGTARLVDIITGLNIRGGKYATIDYNTYAAVTIMIGTNGGVSGNLNNDTPDISIYDINSFPYQYEAEGKTISSVTLNDANDFFKLCFPNTFYGNIALCIEYIRWKNPNCQIFLITIPPNNRGNDISVRTGIFNICDKLGVPVIDAQCRAGLARYNLSFISIDGTHLNVKGNELLASFIANELKRQYYKTDIDNQ